MSFFVQNKKTQTTINQLHKKNSFTVPFGFVRCLLCVCLVLGPFTEQTQNEHKTKIKQTYKEDLMDHKKILNNHKGLQGG